MYDVIIIWAGSAGYPAGMYASRYKLKNIIIGGQPGGALATSHKVENYPGILSAPWKEIMDNFKEHAEVSGSEVLHEMVNELNKNWEVFEVKTSTGKEFQAKKLILATGNNYRKLWFEWEAEFLGKGVSYCATCDGMFFKNRDVVIVWGWDSALTECLYLSELCNKVYLVHRKDTFRAENIWIDQAKSKENIEFVLNEEVLSVWWSMFMEEVKLKSGKSLKADGIFVAIWSDPNTALVEELSPKKDDEGCLIVDKRQETTIPGLYAAGDVTTN